MKIFYICILHFLSLLAFAGGGQDSDSYAYFHGNIKDGIFLSFDEFKNNTPSIPLSDAKIKLADSTSYHLNIASFKIEGHTVKQYKKVWGVCINGVPYINFKGKKGDRSYGKNSHAVLGNPNTTDPVTFYRMEVLGKVCLFALEHIIRENTSPYYSGYALPKEAQFVRQKALDLETGIVYDLTPGYVWDLVKDDAFVLEIFNSGYTNINLVQIIELYNQRNPVFPVAKTDK